jgi:uncharacterized cupin superfamily protein
MKKRSKAKAKAAPAQNKHGSKGELSQAELERVSAGTGKAAVGKWKGSDDGPEETITFVYGKLQT